MAGGLGTAAANNSSIMGGMGNVVSSVEQEVPGPWQERPEDSRTAGLDTIFKMQESSIVR